MARRRQESRDNEDRSALLVGRNPVREALKEHEDRIEKVMIQQGVGGGAIQKIRQSAEAAGVPVQFVPAAKLNRFAGGTNHQGVAATMAPVAYLDVDDLLNGIATTSEQVQARKPMVLLLDRIEDPRNYGAILRSAVAAGVEGVVVPKHRMAPLSTAALKASAGTARSLPIARVHSMTDAIQQLKERGYWVAGATGDGEVTMWEMDWDRPLALVMGNEDRGLRPGIRKVCDYRVAIPLRGPAESLNVGVATGILLFVATRTRP